MDIAMALCIIEESWSKLEKDLEFNINHAERTLKTMNAMIESINIANEMNREILEQMSEMMSIVYRD